MNGVSELAVYVLLAAMVAAVTADLLVIRRVASRLDVFPPVHRALRAGRARADDSGRIRMGALRRLRGLEVYARMRRAFLTDVYCVEASHTDPRRLGPSASALYETGRTAGLLAGLQNWLVKLVQL